MIACCINSSNSFAATMLTRHNIQNSVNGLSYEARHHSGETLSRLRGGMSIDANLIGLGSRGGYVRSTTSRRPSGHEAIKAIEDIRDEFCANFIGYASDERFDGEESVVQTIES